MTVPERVVVALFAATDRFTLPVPLPVTPAVTVIHAALLVAVQAQPAGAVTVTDPVLVVAATESDVGDAE